MALITNYGPSPLAITAILLVLIISFISTTTAAAVTTLPPTVKVKNGTYSGLYLPSFNQDIFLGIPYSYPPTAPYRFMPARPLNMTWSGIRNATNYGQTCPSASAGDLALPYGMSEDCLYVNVIRPSIRDPNRKLPILFWIHGGSYQFGASSLPNYNLTYIVDRSVEMGKPIIAVSVNYRKGPWGLMYGEEIKKEGNENLAIKDVILALRWVKENLGAFGGDVSKVTIQGESSGSFMVGQLIVAGAGKHEQLFHKAIQESGSATTGTYNGTEWYEPKFQALLNATNCTSLACIRQVPYSVLYPAMNGSISGSWYPVLDGDLFPAHPAKLLATGQYHKIPIIDGVNSDEGTDNAYFGIQSEARLQQQLPTVGNPVMTPKNVETLLNIYPYVDLATPSEYGIPLNTALDILAVPALGREYKREAAILGDLYYHATLLHDSELYSLHSTPESPVYIYRFDTLPWNFATNSTLAASVGSNASMSALTNSYKGVAHFSETPFVFRNPAFYGPDPEYKKLADLMCGMWVNFVNHGHPTSHYGHKSWRSSGNATVAPEVAWEPYYVPKAGDLASHGLIIGKQLVIRPESRGGCELAQANYRLAGRAFLVMKMHEAYQE